jgi:pimeloyl-ACP methyl ester carboxylesterase
LFKLHSQNIFPYEKEITDKDHYQFEEINFKTSEKKDSITLSGTLIMPKTGFDKVVIIVPGSGADTRNSHYQLTEALLKNKTAVYRYDDRGYGKSGGANNKANYTLAMMSRELNSCIQALKKKQYLSDKKFGLLGHSQGGMITMETYRQGVPVDFLIQWATPVQKHGEFLKYQLLSGQNTFDDELKYDEVSKKLEVMTVFHKVVEDNVNDENWPLAKKLDKAAKKIGYTKEHYGRFPYLTLASEKDIVRKNFENDYKNIKIPVLYIIGTKDTYVSAEAETALLERFKNNNITIKKMEGLTHYLTKPVLTPETMYKMDEGAQSVILQWLNTIVP